MPRGALAMERLAAHPGWTPKRAAFPTAGLPLVTPGPEVVGAADRPRTRHRTDHVRARGPLRGWLQAALAPRSAGKPRRVRIAQSAVPVSSIEGVEVADMGRVGGPERVG